MSARNPLQVANNDSARKRRAHTKSRGGCGNCKLRRVKCDESRPCCKKCQTFGVSCTYDRISSALQPFEEVAFVLGAPQTTVSVNRAVLGTLNDSIRRQSPGGRAFQLNNRDLALLNRFRERTVLTLGSEKTSLVLQREGTKLAFQHPFLLHAALTLTMMHDRADSWSTKQSVLELYHWTEATSQFNRKLSGPLTSSDRDAIWMASAILGCTTLGQVQGDSPEECWPLRPPSVADLDWLKLGEGKKVVWEIADPLRPDSILRPMALEHYDNMMAEVSDQESFKALPAELLELCGLGPGSSPETNPLYRPAAMLGRLMPIELSQKTLLHFMGFVILMPPDFLALIEAKDHRAVLLLAYYIAKLRGRSPWWSGRRLQMECEAICRYLERFHGGVPHMKKLLEFPRTYLVGLNHASPPGSESTESLSADGNTGSSESSMSFVFSD